MINKVVYSQWSKPAKEEFVGFNNKDAFANCAELSVIHSLRWFKEVELITDEKGYKFLIEDLQLPFTNVIVKLDEINHIGKVHWALGKIEACTMQKEPFMHQDFDAIWFKCPPKKLLESKLAFQNCEWDTDSKGIHGFYKPLLDEAKKLYKLPSCEGIINWNIIRAVNCGFMIFNTDKLFKQWKRMVYEYIEQWDKHHKYGVMMDCPSIIFEQVFLYWLAQHNNIKLNYLGYDWVHPELALEYGYTHLISVSKREKNIELKVKNRLKKELKNGLNSVNI